MSGFRLKIAGKWWRVEYGSRGMINYGTACDVTRRIMLRPGQSDDDLLDTLVHEILHAQDWDLDEGAVTRRATEVARAVRRVFALERR